MADYNVGDVTARLTANATAFQQTIQRAIQQLQQLTQASAQVRQAQASGLQATTQQTQAFTALTQALTQQTQAYRQTQQAAQAAQRQHEGITASLRTQTTATQQASSSWSTMLSVAGGIGLATSVGALASTMAQLGRETVQTGARFEQFRLALSSIAGNAAAGQQQFQFLLNTAQRLGVAFEPLAQGWRRLTAAASQTSLSLEAQQRLLTAVAVESRRVGTSSEELSRLMTGLGQVFSKSKLSMEEMRQQIGEALPTAMAALARGMGRTTEELDKLISTGSVGAVSFAKAFTRGLEDIQRSSGTMADGFTQAMNRLTTSWKAFQDALANSGVNRYFTTVINNVRELVEWMTKLTPQAAQPLQGPTPQGTTLSGGNAPQQREAQLLQSLIDRYTKLAQAGATPTMQAHYAEQVRRAQEELDKLREVITGTENQAAAQAKVTAEVNKTASAQEQQAEFVEDLGKKLAAVRKAQEDFRKEAALAPNLLGRPQGTPAEVETYLKGQQQALRKQLDDLTAFAAAAPQGVVIPPGQRQELAAFDIQLGKLGASIDAIRTKEAARQRVSSDAEQQAKQAISQEITLTAELARVKSFIAGADRSAAEEARARVQQQGVEMQRVIDNALRQFESSAALRERMPGGVAAFQALRQELQAAVDTKGLAAFNAAMEQDVIKPLERLAGRYEETKEARDLDTASRIAAQAVGTSYEQQAADLLETIQQNVVVAREFPDILKSMNAEFAQIKAVRDYTNALEDQLEALQALPDQALDTRLRLQARKAGIDITPDQELLIQANVARDRYNQELRTTQQLQEQLDRMQIARDERASTQARRLATREGRTLTPEQEALVQHIAAQERLNQMIATFENIGVNAANAITSGLMTMVEGTQSVSEAFRAMTRSILQSTAQILLNEGFRALIRLGIGAVAGALAPTTVGMTTPGGGFFQAPAGGGVPFTPPPVAFQHGGIVRKPTLALVGEKGPEAIFNKAQMQALFHAAPSAGGQAAGGNISIINVASKGQAEEVAARERSLGRQVVVNEVLAEMATGESSQIVRMWRTLQR